VIGLDEALDRLIHRRSFRVDFLAGRTGSLGLAEEDLEALASISPEAIEREAASVREDLLRRRHRGSGTLRDLYPRTLVAWTLAHPDDADFVELLSRFMESDSFARYREIPFAGRGLCLEEAFFRFCEAEEIGEAADREAEFLGAMIKAVLTSPDPDFTLPAELHASAAGFFAVATRGAEPILFAAVATRMMTGSLTPFLADVLLREEDAMRVAERHGVSPDVAEAALAKLRALGLFDKVDDYFQQ
jgi:hypothetical protein